MTFTIVPVKMAASMLSRFVLQTSRLSAAAFRQQTFCAAPSRTFSVSSCIFKGKLYTEKHEWVEKRDAGKDTWYTVGISDYAQDSLGEIVYVQLPEVGEEYAKEDTVGCVESVKAASDIYCPMSGTVVEINSALEQTPSLINKEPEAAGWLFKLEAGESVASDLEDLMDEAAYKKYNEEK